VTVQLFTGEDASLLSSALADAVHHLVGDNDRTLMVDDFDGAEFDIAAAVDAAQTPPLFTDRRVVVLRDLKEFTVADLDPLFGYLANALDTTDLVLGYGGRAPKSLTDKVKAAGGVVSSVDAPTKSRDRAHWFEEQVSGSGVRLDGAATQQVLSWLGEDAGRLTSLLDTLASAYGNGRMLKPADVAPFLGEAGGAPPWELTDAIDKGDTTTALTVLHRMMHAGGRHPLQIMATLHTHYAKLLRLDGAEVRSTDAAAELLGVKLPFLAEKALSLYRRLGSSSLHRAIELLAQADLDLRGRRDWPDELVMEVLVARLSRLGGSVSAGRR